MRTFKAFDMNMQNKLGSKVIQYEVGGRYEEDEARCAGTGFHSAEYVLDVFGYYTYGDCIVCACEALGDVDEDGYDSKVASTVLEIKEELSSLDIMKEAIEYMVDHPERDWKRIGTSVEAKEEASACAIAIGRGEEPKVQGRGQNTLMALIKEKDGIEMLRAFRVGVQGIKQNKWYTLDEQGKVVEVEE